jgi:hypothetical protein
MQIRERISKEAEGKLFIHRWFSVMSSKTVFYSENYYVVRNGVVFSIHKDLTETPSGDDIVETYIESECLGEYDKDKIKIQEFDYIPYTKIRKAFIPKPKSNTINQ